MNQKELNELRRRFKPDRTAISKVYGCYVSSSRQIISYVDAPLGLLSQEEQEMYLNLLKKTLSGALGRNLIDIVFSTAQVADSDEHRLLQTLRPKGWAVRPLKRYASWVQNVVRQFGPYPAWA